MFPFFSYFCTNINILYMKNSVFTDSFSLNQTQIIKGIAILCIMLHNLFHWMSPMNALENEFSFDSNHIFSFFDSFASTPWEFINIIFSYLGHYGVEIFIFISGYGLAKSFRKSPKPWGRFMAHRLKKIYPLLIIAFLYFFFTRISIYNTLPKWEEIKSMIYKLLFIHTFIPKEGMTLDGPWWFFGLIVQLYVFFPLLYKCIEKHGFKAFFTVSLISYATIYASLYAFKMPKDIYLMQNAIGHFPEFCLGILLAKNKTLTGNIWCFTLAVTAFSLGNFHLAFYPLTFISITYIFVYLSIALINKDLNIKHIKSTISVFGKYSMVLFATHGLFRWQYVVLADQYNNALITVVLAVVFLIEVLILAIPAMKLYEFMTKTKFI